jgi:hypothetical protein
MDVAWMLHGRCMDVACWLQAKLAAEQEEIDRVRRDLDRQRVLLEQQQQVLIP